VVLDTGPLLTCLALHYLDGTEADKFRRSKVLQDVRRGSDLRFAETEQERFQVLMSRAKRLLTTPHVLAEVLRLRGHPALSQDRERFRRLSLELLADGRIEEISGPLQALCADPEYRELICRLGLTDAAVVYLAAKERCLLLTDEERKFDTYTAGAGFEIRTLDEYLRPPE
jgi:predicted nucleic acid-binding protein